MSSKPRFDNVSCSQCGKSFGPGDHGYSHCSDHTVVMCPKCKSTEVERIHHSESFALPECWAWHCGDCAHQWGVE